MRNIAESARVDTTGLTIIKEGEFRSLSFTEGCRNVYDISFGNESALPSCTCESWYRTAFPCKHMFAVMNKFPEYTWYSLSPLYTNSPFMTLDPLTTDDTNDDINTNFEQDANDVPEIVNSNVPLVESCENVTESDNTKNLVDLKKEETCYKYLGEQCRSKLKELRELSFLAENDNTMIKSLYEHLCHAAEDIKEKLPKESALHLRDIKVERDGWKRTKKLQSIPIKKKAKIEKLKRKLGVKKDINVEASKIVIDLTSPAKLQKIEEEIVFDDLLLSAEGDELESESVLQLDEIEDIKDQSHKNKNPRENSEKESFQQLHLQNTSLRSSLSNDDLDRIGSNRMLNDNAINVCQKMIANQFNEKVGLQDPILGKTLPSMFTLTSHLCKFYTMEVLIGYQSALIIVNKGR